jgi:hypothetical protein
MEEISRKPSIQAVAWILPAAFNQIYVDNWKQSRKV